MEYEFLWLLNKAQDLGFNIDVASEGGEIKFQISGPLSHNEATRNNNLVAAGIDPNDFDFRDNFERFSQRFNQNGTSPLGGLQGGLS